MSSRARVTRSASTPDAQAEMHNPEACAEKTAHTTGGGTLAPILAHHGAPRRQCAPVAELSGEQRHLAHEPLTARLASRYSSPPAAHGRISAARTLQVGLRAMSAAPHSLPHLPTHSDFPGNDATKPASFAGDIMEDRTPHGANPANGELPQNDRQLSTSLTGNVEGGGGMPPLATLANGEFGRHSREQSHDEDEGRHALSCKNPWSTGYESHHHDLTMPSARDYAYTFLRNSTKEVLRILAKDLNVKQHGVKNAVACFLLQYADKKVSEGAGSYEIIFGEVQRAFWTALKNQGGPLFVAPTRVSVEEHAPRPLRSKSTAATVEPPMSCSEFSRLMGILTEDENARAALISSGVDLSREQQQRRVLRDVFWSTVIEPLFNDSETKVALDVRGCVDGDEELGHIDSNVILTANRNGAWLKDKYFEVRSLFTRGYERWSRSGQNDAEGNDFFRFVPRAPGATGLSSQGRHATIMFHSFRCGRQDEDTALLNFACRLVRHGAGYDDGDGDVDYDSRGGLARKKRKVAEEDRLLGRERNEHIATLTTAFTSYLQRTAGSGSTAGSSVATSSGASTQESVSSFSLIQKIAALTKQRAELMILVQNDDPITSETLILLDTKIKELQQSMSRTINV